jgi:HEAT repeat protein
VRATFIALCLFCAACQGTPKDPEGWARAAVRRSRAQDKLDAVREVRRAPGDRRAAVPYLVELLKEGPRVRGEAATALGEFGDPAAIQPLLAALDLSAGKELPADLNEANRHVASALGALRARAAVPVLLQLLRSRDGFTQVAAVDALGEIGDPAAVDALSSLATGDEVESFVARKALLALGKIGEQRATPGVLRMLFRERAGVSFFPEAAFAAYQIGAPMAPPLVTVLKGEDRELAAWAREHGVAQGVLHAKAAQLLGEVGDARAVAVLLESLAYRDPVPQLQLLVRVCAAESLGRLRAGQATQTLARMLVQEQDSDARDRYAEALACIGDPSALGALRSAARQGTWEERVSALAALSRLGTPDDGEILARAAREMPAHAVEVARMQERIAAAGECGTDVRCWSAKLSDPRGWVRDRAALEVGRRGGPDQAEALAVAAALPVDSDDDLAARHHALLALEWVTARPTPAATAIADRLDALVSRDKGRSLTTGVNEHARRLAARLRRQTAAASR